MVDLHDPPEHKPFITDLTPPTLDEARVLVERLGALDLTMHELLGRQPQVRETIETLVNMVEHHQRTRVEIDRTKAPSTCDVYVDGVKVWSGVDWSALLEDRPMAP